MSREAPVRFYERLRMKNSWPTHFSQGLFSQLYAQGIQLITRLQVEYEKHAHGYRGPFGAL